MMKIAIFASGSGTNAQRIIEYFANQHIARVDLILCNKPEAYVLERAKKLHVASRVFTRDEFYKTNSIANLLRDKKIDFIVLAGFLWLIPDYLIQAYPKRIINIHPALLPKYGGKGMFGEHVHEAVIANGEKESGITIHYVNENYDEGDIIFQAKCGVESSDTAETLAQKIHQLEHLHFPSVIHEIIKNTKK
jgi:phosphoribosylglycinamide formyltransferase 1